MTPDAWISFPVGILIATVVSIIGIGGGILWMPFFLIVLNLRPDSAVFASFLIQIAGMGSGSFVYLIRKKVDLSLALVLLMITIPGLFLGSWINHLIPKSSFTLILGLITLATAFWFVSSDQEYIEKKRNRADIKKMIRYGWVVGLFSIFSGLLSISIGEWLVPIMRNKFALKMRVAIATSILTIFGSAFIGAFFHWCMGSIAPTSVLLWAIPGVLIGGQIGPRLAERMNDDHLKEVFIFLLTLIGIHFIYNAY